jgi:phosphatidylserine/phosphatidylglycerophosphate/cardiolipin synthase-like enzyme
MAEDWLLTRTERGNPATRLARAWSTGNDIRVLIHGAAYFPRLLAAVRRQVAGDLLLFTDWRGDPDELLDGPGTEVSRVFADAARRDVVVRGLIWRSHLDRLQFSERENRHLGREVEAAGGQCVLDMRVRPGGSHHQKLVVLRHPGRPELDVAYVGGIDLCHSRHDGEAHSGDPQHQPMSAVYGPRPPWHDVQLEIRGPAVGDVEIGFRERWDDPNPPSRNPLHRARDLLQHQDSRPGPLPPQAADPQPVGTQTVQLLRTYPRRRHGYPFAPQGERSVARGYLKVLPNARTLIYLEDQYLWSRQVAEPFARALAGNPELRLIAVLPLYPDQDGRLSMPPNEIGRISALRMLYEAGRERVSVYGVENHAGTAVYVHAKVCVIDDVWACVGSDNLNRRSWTHDSELACAVIDAAGPQAAEPGADGGPGFARRLRVALAREHLDGEDEPETHDPLAMFDAFARSAARLDAWHAADQRGPRPPGRLRRYRTPHVSPSTRVWANVLYRTIYDPDARPLSLKRTNRY